jgi:general secretion pathway protein F
MSGYSYTAIQETGKRVTGTLRCRSRREAIMKLRELGYHPLRLDETASNAAPKLRDRFRRISTYDLAVFTRQLSSLLKAGMPVLEALATLRQQCSNRQLSLVIEDIGDTLREDAKSIAEALEHHPRVFDAVFRGLVRSGEESGNLAEVLRDLATHLSRAARLRGQVLGAFIYPLFLLILGVAAVFVLITFVIPKFQELFVSFGQVLPWPTRALIAVSGFCESWWWAILLGAITGAMVAGFALRRPKCRLHVDVLLLRMPVMGPMCLRIEVARIGRTLAALLAGGVRVIEALEVTGQTARNLKVRGTFAGVLAAVSAGESLATAFTRAQVFPPMMINLIRTGEDSGELPEMLEELSAIYEDEADRAVNGAVKLLEPMLILVMGGVIAAIVAAVILPVFQAHAMVGQG